MRRLHVIYATIWVLVVLSVAKAQDTMCKTLDSQNQTAYLGWPILFNLDDVINSCDDIFDYSYIKSTLSYRESNETLYDTGVFDIYGSEYPSWEYQIPNVTNDTPDIVMIVRAVNSTVCCTLEKNLRKEIFLNQTCEEASEDANNVRTRRQTEGDLVSISCDVLDDSPSPKINVSQYTVTWYYQCNTDLPDGVGNPDGALDIGKMNHTKHPGLYSCSIVHQGQLRYIMHDNLCIQPDISSSELTVSCDRDKYLFEEGNTAEVNCSVDINQGRGQDEDYVMVFYPLYNNKSKDLSKDNISCPPSLLGNWTVAPDDRVSCIASTVKNASEEKFKCFYRIPTEKEWEAEQNKKIKRLTMTYRIDGVQKEDFGYFMASAVNQGNTRVRNDTFEISRQSHPNSIAIILGSVFGGVVVLLLIALVCFRLRLQIRFHWRRSNCVPYAKTTDVKRFGAYLTYYWSNEDGRRVENLHYKSFIDAVTERLLRLNCPVYDPGYAPHLFNWDVKNIREVQLMCDRVVVILTRRYIEENENDFNLYTNFLKSTFVFIKAPDFDDAFENLEKKRRCALEAQLRRNYVISWDGKPNLSERFKMKLELAMPKRRQQKETMAYDHQNEALYENNI